MIFSISSHGEIDDRTTDAWSSHDIKTSVRVDNNGNSVWLESIRVRSSCKFMVSNFPYDKQLCEIIFSSWSGDTSKMLLLNRGIILKGAFPRAGQNCFLDANEFQSRKIAYPEICSFKVN